MLNTRLLSPAQWPNARPDRTGLFSLGPQTGGAIAKKPFSLAALFLPVDIAQPRRTASRRDPHSLPQTWRAILREVNRRPMAVRADVNRAFQLGGKAAMQLALTDKRLRRQTGHRRT